MHSVRRHEVLYCVNVYFQNKPHTMPQGAGSTLLWKGLLWCNKICHWKRPHVVKNAVIKNTIGSCLMNHAFWKPANITVITNCNPLHLQTEIQSNVKNKISIETGLEYQGKKSEFSYTNRKYFKATFRFWGFI